MKSTRSSILVKLASLAALCAGVLGASADASAQTSSEYPLESRTSTGVVTLPESFAYNNLSDDFYVTAFNGGEITRLEATGTSYETVWYKDSNPNISLLGIEFDPKTSTFSSPVFYVCANDVKTNPSVPVGWVYRMVGSSQPQLYPEKGYVTDRIALPTPSICNDLVVDPNNGDVYVTDSANPNVYRIPAGTTTRQLWATSPSFAPAAPGQIGLNGIDLAPDGTTLLVVKSAPATLFSIAKGTTSRVIRQVTVGGDGLGNPNDPQRFPGPDGLDFLNGKLYVVFNGGVQELTFSNTTYSAATSKTNTSLPLGLSAATSAEGDLFVLDGDVFPVTNLGLPPQLPFKILKVNRLNFN